MEINSCELLITDKSKLTGLPDGALEADTGTAKAKDKEGWLFDISMPSYILFLKYADNRELSFGYMDMAWHTLENRLKDV
jgi:peptidyl-dipeptidase Dcp